MKLPFYAIFAPNGDELTPYIDSFRFEDCMEEDDLLEVRVNPQRAQMFDDLYGLKSGDILLFSFGYRGGEQSSNRRARVTDVVVRYSATVNVTVKALDMGTVMKKTSDGKVWKGVTLSQMVSEIAPQYGLRAVTIPTTRVWESTPQGNLSDLAFLSEMAKREGGDLVVYVKDGELRLEKKGILAASQKTYVYGDGTGSVISFEPANKESGATPKVTIVGFSPETKTPIKEKGYRYDGDATDKYSVEYSDNKLLEAAKVKLWGVQVGNPEPSPGGPRDSEAYRLARSATRDKALAQETATLRVEGDPTIRVNSTVTISGVLKRHTGNWLVKKVSHDIGTGGYITTLTLARNASKVGSVTPEGGVNTSVGGKEGRPQEKALKKYDKDGNPI